LKKKISASHSGILNMLITSRSVASYFDLALSTENGLIFGTLINQYREIKFNVNSEKIA
jgi:hypothetical protein